MIVREFDRPRVMGPIAIDSALKAALANLRAAAGLTGPAEVDADQLHAVEVAVSYRLASDLLALYAAGLPLFAERHQLHLDAVVAHTGQLRVCKAPGDLIGLGIIEDDFLALSLRAPEVDETVLYRVDGDSGTGQRMMRLVDWVVGLASGCAPVDPELFRPQLVRAPPAGSSGRRVRHKTFGEGRVFLEIGSGAERKLKVDFEKVGLKTLLARFVEFVDE